MNLPETIALFIVMTILALVPSTSVALVVARSSTAGFLNGVAVTAGIVAGDLVFVCLAILGMATLAEVLGSLFLVIKYLAGAYLIWFGISLLKSKPSVQITLFDQPASTLSTSFFAGLLITLGDVKAIFFYASLFPVFVDLATIKASDIVAIVALTIVSVGGVKLAYAYFAVKLASYAKGLNAGRAVRFAAGGFMVSAGAYLMAKV